MSRVFVDSNIRNISSLPIVAILGIAPLAVLGIRFDLALCFALVAIVVVPLTAMLLHILHDLTDEKWLSSWCMLISGFWVSIAELVLRLVNPAILANMAMYLPILAVSPLILVQVQLIRKNESFGQLFRDSTRMVLVFALLLVGTALIREVLGNGTLTFLSTATDAVQLVIPGLSDFPVALFSSAAGGLVLVGFILAFRNWLVLKSEAEPAETANSTVKGDSL